MRSARAGGTGSAGWRLSDPDPSVGAIVGGGRGVPDHALAGVCGPRGRIDVTIRLLRIRDAHVGRVPFEELAGEALRQASEQEGLGERALNFEVRQRRRSALARSEPLIDSRLARSRATLSRRSLILLRFGIHARAI